MARTALALLLALAALLLAASSVGAIPGYVKAWQTSPSGTVGDMEVGSYIAVLAGDKLYILLQNGTAASTTTLSYTPEAVAVYGSTIAVASDTHVYLYFPNGTEERSFLVSGARDIALTSSLVVVGGTGGVKAYARDGSLQWSVNSTGDIDVVAAGGSVFAANTAVYRISLGGTLYWNVSLGAAAVDLQALGTNSVAAATSSSVFMISGGSIEWRRNFTETVKTLALCGDTVLVYTSGHVYGLSPSNGSVLWSEAVGSTPVRVRCGGDSIYVAFSGAVVKYVKVAGVTITTEPSGARVYVDGRYKGKTPLTVSLPPGSHSLRLTYSTYEIRDRFTLDPGESKTLHYVFNGTLIVVTMPPKSRVRLNGVCMGFTPVKRELKPGTYDMLVVNGPLSYRRKITIEPGETLNLTIVFNGTLIVETRPEGLSVKVDGKLAGKTPIRMQVKPGPHHVVILFKNETIIRSVSLEAGEIKRIFLQFNSTILIDIVPKDAEVYLDGKETGKAHGLYKVQPGEHVVLAYCGGHEYRKILNLGAGEDAVARAVFNLTLKVDSIPRGVDVYINGSKRGVTPLSTLLPAGSYVVELRYGNESVEKTVSLTSCKGEATDIVVVFNSTLSIDTFPRGLPVSVDGRDVGTSPVKVKVPVGEHTVSARWILYMKSVKVDAGQGGAEVKIEFWEPILVAGAAVAAIVVLLAYLMLARRSRSSYAYGGGWSRPVSRPRPTRRRRGELYGEEYGEEEEWDEW